MGQWPMGWHCLHVSWTCNKLVLAYSLTHVNGSTLCGYTVQCSGQSGSSSKMREHQPAWKQSEGTAMLQHWVRYCRQLPSWLFAFYVVAVWLSLLLAVLSKCIEQACLDAVFMLLGCAFPLGCCNWHDEDLLCFRWNSRGSAVLPAIYTISISCCGDWVRIAWFLLT